MTYKTGELSIICRAHRRRCVVAPPGGDGGRTPRIRHETDGELCFSQKHLVRREEEYDRARVLGELVAEFA